MTEPNQKEIDSGVPTIKLENKEWPVPLLAVRQNRTVVPALMRVVAKFQTVGINSVSGLDSQTYDDLITITYTALNRAHPSMTKAEFEDMAISTMELMDAIQTISQQTGLIVKIEAKTNQKKVVANSQTGTQSSQKSSPQQDGDGTNARIN